MDITGKVDCFFEQEEWRDIKGFEGLYQVSSIGRVRSLDKIVKGSGRGFPRTQKGRILKLNKTGTGYFFVILSNGQQKMKLVHRLVAETFLDSANIQLDVNHIDGNKLNNVYTNLEWCTRKENIQHAFSIGLAKPHHNQINKKKLSIQDSKGIVKVFNSIAEAASYIGVCQSSVSRACRGKLHHAGGYICKFI